MLWSFRTHGEGPGREGEREGRPNGLGWGGVQGTAQTKKSPNEWSLGKQGAESENWYFSISLRTENSNKLPATMTIITASHSS